MYKAWRMIHNHLKCKKTLMTQRRRQALYLNEYPVIQGHTCGQPIGGEGRENN